MKLSTRARYGLRATTELALLREGLDGEAKPVPLARIAKRQGIPEQYLRQIFLSLRRAGIVRAVRGTSGGYLLGREPVDISARDVVRAMGERLEPVFCIREPSECERAAECPTRPLWSKLARAMETALSTTTVAQLAETCPGKGCPASAPGYMFNI